jgi:hypothetical protein
VAFWNGIYDDLVAGINKTEEEELSIYARMERQHDNRQPFIKDELVEAIKAYNCVSYRQLAVHINNWCQHT